MNNEIIVMNSGIAIRDIPGYEGLYSIDEMGSIWSEYTHKHLKSYLDKNGYPHIWISKNKEEKQYLVHRLIALTFIPNPNNLPEVEHSDNNPSNCTLNNLFWSTHGDNMAHASRDGLMSGRINLNPPRGENRGNVKLTNKDVLNIRLDRQKGLKFYQIATKYRVSKGLVCDICHQKRWKHISDVLPITEVA
jgi:hypothetical protein